MKATFIDFEDSFTFNVVQELTLAGFEVEVINWKDYEKNPGEGLLVLGPGPGHPDDYQQVYPLIEKWMDEKKPLFGVCLGHQILWSILGEDIVRSKEPLHGQKIKLELTEEWRKWLKLSKEIYVQRYNSLCVPSQASFRNPYLSNYIQNDEILITRSDTIITYQFHPESIGTTFRREFFTVVRSIMS